MNRTHWNTLFSKLGIETTQPILGICTDSRQIKPGDVFVAINKGSLYIGEALHKGAVYVVSSHLSTHDAVFHVDCSVVWLGELAELYRKELAATVIGVTGSVGKTSLTQLLYYSLQKFGKTAATYGNENSEIGVALTVLRAPLDAKYLIVELGISKPKDMDYIAKIANPDIAVITKIGPSHLARLGSRQGVWQEKAKVLHYAKYAVLNKNCRYCKQYEGHDVKWFSADEYLENENNVDRYKAEAYAAVNAVSEILGVQSVFQGFCWPSSRLTTVKHQSGAVIIDDCYNANYLSYITALKYIRGASFKLVIVGEMGDLGESSQHYHQMLAYALNEMQVDTVILFGKETKCMLHMVMADVICVANKQDLSTLIQQYLVPDATILIKGSRHLKLEEVLP